MKLSPQQYLTEDLAQIQRYFPGAKPVALRTPFDLTKRPKRKFQIPNGKFQTNANDQNTKELPKSSSRSDPAAIFLPYLMTLESVIRRRTRWMA